MRYYHGGGAGLAPGDFILPVESTGAKPAVGGSGGAAKRLYRRDRVYITPDVKFALFFAARKSNGKVYEVEPVRYVETDPHWALLQTEGTGYRETKQCERARVLAIEPIADYLFQDARALMSPIKPSRDYNSMQTAKKLNRRAFEKKQRKTHRQARVKRLQTGPKG
jgi:hypothetical protein